VVSFSDIQSSDPLQKGSNLELCEYLTLSDRDKLESKSVFLDTVSKLIKPPEKLFYSEYKLVSQT